MIFESDVSISDSDRSIIILQPQSGIMYNAGPSGDTTEKFQRGGF